MDYFRRWGWRRTCIGFKEAKGYTIYFGILWREKACGLIHTIIDPAQSTTNYLFTKKLGGKCAHTKDMSDGIYIPAFGKHRHGDDTFDILPKLTGLADCIHYFAQEFFVCRIFASRKTFAIILVKIFDLFGKNPFEFIANLLTTFNLGAVYNERVRMVVETEPVLVAENL